MKRSSLSASLTALALAVGLVQTVQASNPAAKADKTTAAAGPSRQQVINMVRTTCPDRIKELLGKAMPTQAATNAQVKGVCACVNDKVAKEPKGMGADELQHESTYHALNCAQPLVREYNSAWVRQQFSGYLTSKRAWTIESVDTLALCLADTLWSQNYNPNRHGKREEPSGNAYWTLCAGKAGHASESLPSPEDLGLATAEEPKTKP